MFLAPPDLVASCSEGIRIRPDVLCRVAQADGFHHFTTGVLAGAEWCSYNGAICLTDLGGPCPIEECVHVWWVYSGHELAYVHSEQGLPIAWSASHVNGTLGSGMYAGPADWNVDGAIDSRDYFDFLDAFFAGSADYNLTGTTDSQDFFDFIGDFTG